MVGARRTSRRHDVRRNTRYHLPKTRRSTVRRPALRSESREEDGERTTEPTRRVARPGGLPEAFAKGGFEARRTDLHREMSGRSTAGLLEIEPLGDRSKAAQGSTGARGATGASAGRGPTGQRRLSSQPEDRTARGLAAWRRERAGERDPSSASCRRREARANEVVARIGWSIERRVLGPEER